MSIISGANAVTGTGAVSYQIERSLRFNSADSAYLDRSVATSGNLRKWTVSCWVKRGTLSGSADRYLFTETNEDGSGADIKYTIMRFTTADKLELADRWASAGDEKITTTAVFRDPSAWYHVVFVRDSDNATAADRAIIYVNGVRQNVTGSFTQSKDSSWNKQTTASYGQEVSGRFRFAGSWYYGSDFYLSEVHSIDGQALDPTSFGEYNSETGVWQPKAYTGSYGTNGFYLDFADNSSTTALGYDAAGSNDWTPNNFSVTAGAGNDSLVDTPTNYGTDTGVGGEVRGNYCTWNAVSGYAVTLTNGNLDYTTGTSSNPVTSTWSLPTSGKWYWEVTVSSVAEAMIGIQTRNNLAYAGPKTAYYRQGGSSNSIYIEGSANAYNASSYTNGDVIAVGYDADNSQIRWYKNNVQQGGPYTLTSLDNLTPIIIQASGSGSTSGVANFGQRPFAYAAPTGFKALCTQNLPEPTVVDGGEYFNPVLYTGNGSTQSITGVGFQPDLVWAKCRSNSYHHKLVDAVRGATLTLSSSQTAAEQTETNSLTAFNSDGFSLGSISSMNASAETFVAWNWKANGAGVSNTAGSITSTVSANTTAGFSIATYSKANATNETFGHGLGVAPSMVIVKPRNTSPSSWIVWHSALTSTEYLILNATDGKGTLSSMWNSTAPSSTVVSLGTAWGAANHVAYCFAPVAGYSAFGSYTGNGSSDGPFVYTGFRPRFILTKCSNLGSVWAIWDTERNTYNAVGNVLQPQASDAEISPYNIDVLSNGFKFRDNNSNWNGSASSPVYIYAAFAENPFKYSLAR